MLGHPEIGNKRENIPPELIVFSAALHGGLADLDLAAALFEALIDPGDCFHLSGRTSRVYTDLLVAAQGLADQETRRWYADDTLICLIARVSLTTDLNRFRADLAANKSVATRRNRIADRIWNKVEAEFERQQKLESGYDPRRLPQRFKSLLDNIRTVMHSDPISGSSWMPLLAMRQCGWLTEPSRTIKTLSGPASSRLAKCLTCSLRLDGVKLWPSASVLTMRSSDFSSLGDTCELWDPYEYFGWRLWVESWVGGEGSDGRIGRKYLKIMVGTIGFEPTTSSVSRKRSNQLSYAPMRRSPQVYQEPSCEESSTPDCTAPCAPLRYHRSVKGGRSRSSAEVRRNRGSAFNRGILLWGVAIGPFHPQVRMPAFTRASKTR